MVNPLDCEITDSLTIHPLLSTQILMSVLKTVITVHRTAQILLDHSFVSVAQDLYSVMTEGHAKVYICTFISNFH